jgi:hypothetical protein
MVWAPGESGNPKRNGARPLGSRNKRTTEAIEAIIAAGHQDPLLTLAELQAKSEDEGIRATAANMLAPYLHSKVGTTPVPAPPRYMEIQQEINKPKSIAEAYDNILYLSDLKAKGEIDIESADSLISDQRVVLNAMVDEAKLLAASGDPSRDQRIVIEGGMPALPGTEVIMPDREMNGHQLELSAVAHPPQADPEPIIPVHGAPEPPKSDYGIPEDRLPNDPSEP